MEFLRHTAPRPGGSGQWDSRNALPHYLGVVGSGTPATHCPIAWVQWAMPPLQCSASLPGGSRQLGSCNHCRSDWGKWAVELLQYTASLPGGSRQGNYCNRISQCRGGSGQCNFCNALPYRLGAVGSGTPATHCLTAWGQLTVQLVQYTASLPRGSRQWNTCNALPHCPGGSGQWNGSNTLPQCLGGTGQRDSCNVLPQGAAVFKARPHHPGGDRESCPDSARCVLQGVRGGLESPRPGHRQ